MTENKHSIGNREYKSDLFSMLLRNRSYALDIYNALNGTDYGDPELVEIITLESGIALSVRNDASFIICHEMNFYEHQSTYSPNSPLRQLIYVSNTIMKQISRRDLYSRRQIQIPAPRFVVFYNGTEKRPPREILRLSDSFTKHMENPELELICTVININPEYNQELMEKSRVLYGYTYFVEQTRGNMARQKESGTPVNLETAIEAAIDHCIENHILEEFLRENRNEVAKVMVLDYTWERREELIRAEEYEEGRAEGERSGRQAIVLNMLKRGISDEEIRDLTGCGQDLIDEVRKNSII